LELLEFNCSNVWIALQRVWIRLQWIGR